MRVTNEQFSNLAMATVFSDLSAMAPARNTPAETEQYRQLILAQNRTIGHLAQGLMECYAEIDRLEAEKLGKGTL